MIKESFQYSVSLKIIKAFQHIEFLSHVAYKFLLIKLIYNTV